MTTQADYTFDALKVVRPGPHCAEPNHQTAGMYRLGAISRAETGSQGLWMGYVTMPAGAIGGVHHHAECESGIYILKGHARFDFGEGLRQSVEARAGDFVYVPAYALHREVNLSQTEPVEMIIARTTQTTLVVNVPWPAEPDIRG